MQDIIDRLLLTSRGTYTFVLESYVNMKQKILCVCNTCGYQWHPTIQNLVYRGDGCKKCKYKARRKMGTDIANKRLTEVSAGRYKHIPLVEYSDSTQRVECVCLQDSSHIWYASYSQLVNQHTGCPICRFDIVAKKQRPSQEDAMLELDKVAKAHNYQYEPFIYKNRKQQVKCRCLNLGCNREWTTSYESLVKKDTGCAKCAGTARMTADEVNSLIKTHANIYNYDFMEVNQYKNKHQRVECKCKVCTYIWNPTIASLLNSRGCVLCTIKRLGLQRRHTREHIMKILADVAGIRYNFKLPLTYESVEQKIRCTCNKCGESWYARIQTLVTQVTGCPNHCFIKSSFVSTISKNKKNGFTTAQQYHDYKTNECKKLGVTLIHISEQDYIDDKQGTISMISHHITSRL